MSKREWVTPEGLRGDGRRARELRRLRVELGVLPHADGSACVEMGNTKVGWRVRRGGGERRWLQFAGCIRSSHSCVLPSSSPQVLAAVFGPRVPPGRPSGGDAPVDVRCEFAAATFATGEFFCTTSARLVAVFA